MNPSQELPPAVVQWALLWGSRVWACSLVTVRLHQKTASSVKTDRMFEWILEDGRVCKQEAEKQNWNFIFEFLYLSLEVFGLWEKNWTNRPAWKALSVQDF